jgi:hypothetical protein
LDKPIVLRARSLVAFGWVATAGCIVAFLALAISGPGPNPDAGDRIGTLVLGIALSLGFSRGTRMRVVMNDSGVTVYHLFRTESVPWVDLADADVDYGGLRLIRTDGQVLTARSMGKPNWATWMGRTVPADDRAEMVRQEIARRRGHDGA